MYDGVRTFPLQYPIGTFMLNMSNRVNMLNMNIYGEVIFSLFKQNHYFGFVEVFDSLKCRAINVRSALKLHC